MLPQEIHQKLFPNSTPRISQTQTDIAHKLLKDFDLLGKTQEPLPLLDLELPCLAGKNLGEHFHILGKEQAEPYLGMAKKLAASSPPHLPNLGAKLIRKSGWMRYSHGNEEPESVDYPSEDLLVFDVEVLFSASPYPLIAVAASPSNWYVWLSPFLLGEQSTNDCLIPMGNDSNKPRIIIGHNVSFDRGRILEEYSIVKSRTMFLDTMSLHNAVGGLSSQQRPSWSKYKKLRQSASDDEFNKRELDELEQPWHKVSSMSNLSDVARLHTGITVNKEIRKIFETGTIDDVREHMDDLIRYCFNDVKVTYDLFKALLPKFLEKCPHPVSFAGILHMGKAFLTVNQNWDNYIKSSDDALHRYSSEIEEHLMKAVHDALEYMQDGKWKEDPWLRNLDWSIKVDKVRNIKNPEMKRKSDKKINALSGKPMWYRNLWDPKEEAIRISMSKKVVPYLLKLEWNSFPLYHSPEYGWTYRVPKEMAPMQTQTPLHFSGDVNDQTFDPIASLDEDHVYFKVPHKDGPENNCGNPLSKPYIGDFEQGILTSQYGMGADIMRKNAACNYWISARDRIVNQFIVWKEGNRETNTKEGFIIPQLVVMGTITRRAVESTWMAAANPKEVRIGSELKSLIQPPPGYKFVGADVDSQELWIASIFGDSQIGIHGASPFGFMTLQGSKTNGTDLHSRTAQLLGISRDMAKVFNYARIYGAGSKYAVQMLQQCSTEADLEKIQETARKLYAETKGLRGKLKQSKSQFWYGGTESLMFNVLEAIVRWSRPRTPVLGCEIPDGLLPENVSASTGFLPSRVNWVVQSSAVDYLHLLLVSMDYLCRRLKIDARFMLSIHDEVHFMVKEEHADLAAYALQVSNLWVRSFFAYQLDMMDLPLSVAFFSAVDIDHCFRKETFLTCVTPSNPSPIPAGVSYDIYKIAERLDEWKIKNGADSVIGRELESIQVLKHNIPVLPNPCPPVPFKETRVKIQMCRSDAELKEVANSLEDQVNGSVKAKTSTKQMAGPKIPGLIQVKPRDTIAK